MEPTEAPPSLVLTDAAPLPTDRRCPACRAPEKERIVASPFGGAPYQVCGRCGYEWPREER